MNEAEIFNKRIRTFLKEQPDSSASNLIKRIIESFGQSNNYHTIFDDFTYRIGLGFFNDEIVNKNYKTIGYIPCLK